MAEALLSVGGQNVTLDDIRAKAKHEPLKAYLRGAKPVAMKRRAEPSAEYVARMAALRARLEESEYQTLVGAEESYSGIVGGVSFSQLERNQISTIFNILLTMAAVGTAAWYWTAYRPPIVRVSLSLTSALVLGIVETILYARYLSNVAEAERRRAQASKHKAGLVPSKLMHESGRNEKPAMHRPELKKDR
ncbi:Vacuolar ATPase assembly integral membrane protein [Savitreella phatthalungensis]